MIQKIVKDKFIRDSMVFFAGSMIIAVLNYAYHPILSRMMSVASFGEVQTLISLFLQTGVLLAVFGNIVINLTANSDEKSQNVAIINQLYKIALTSSLILTGGIIILTPFLKHFLNFNSASSFWMLAASLPLSISFTFRKFFLQGIKKFKEVSIAGIFFAGGRLLMAVFLVGIGLGVFGAVSAITLATIFSLFYAYVITRKELKLSFKQKISLNKKLLEEFKYGGLILAATGLITFLYTADMLFVKHYFSPELAGFYGGIATVARIVFFVTGSVVGVLVASVKIKSSFRENTKILLKGVAIIFCIGASVTGVFVLFPEQVITLLVGERYDSYAYLLPRMAFLSFLVSLASLLIMFFLALRKYLVIWVSVSGASIVLLASVFRHDTLIDVVNNFLAGTVIIIFLLVGIFYKVKMESAK